MTDLNPLIRYAHEEEIAKEASASGRPHRDVAPDMTHFEHITLERLLDKASHSTSGRSPIFPEADDA